MNKYLSLLLELLISLIKSLERSELTFFFKIQSLLESKYANLPTFFELYNSGRYD
jgi:hypothetical protein